MKTAIELSGRTALKRSGPSLPVRALADLARLVNPVLDYGCGHGADLCWLLEQGYEAEGYDPVHRPAWGLLSGRYRTVLCIYVLNTLPRSMEKEVIARVNQLLTDDGTAYFAVRTDVNDERGVQRMVLLDEPAIPLGSFQRFRLYRMGKQP